MAPAATPSSGNSAEAQGGNGRGWLSDLLTRASRDEEPLPSTAHAEEARQVPPSAGQPAETQPEASAVPAKTDGSDAPAKAPDPTASKEPAEQAVSSSTEAASSGDALDSISMDIARIINGDAAFKAWERQEAGERHVFSRRIYSSQGQQTFDEIRRKYHRDHDFKETVDRYVGEFERLLTEVAKDAQAQKLRRTYLGSETGKVYLMLAHASGRFE
jgi:hypothetical protein